MARSTRVILVLLGAAALGGCAATGAVTNARQSLEQARGSGAEAKAPYEYYAAEAFLGLAEHESAELDGAAAKEFAEKSAQFSSKALEKSGGGAR